MNSSAISWMSQPGIMEDAVFTDPYCDFIDSFDEDDVSAVFSQDFQDYLSATGIYTSNCSSTLQFDTLNDNYSSNSSWYTSTAMEQTQQPADGNYSTSSFSAMQNVVVNPDQASSRPMILNFGHQLNPSQNLQEVHQQQVNLVVHESSPEEDVVVPEVNFMSATSGNLNSKEAAEKVQATKKRSRIRPPSQTYDHIVAERRRREQLSQLFVSLSTIVPGLKKMDKGSVLEDAIKYLKHLQDRVKTLEEQAEKYPLESVVVVKKSQIVMEDEGSSDEQSGGGYEEQPLPEIEARVCENHILLRVHCEKHKGVLPNLLCKVESLNMIVVNTNATQFGNVSLDITIIAELEKEFNLTGKEVATAIREALLQC